MTRARAGGTSRPLARSGGLLPGESRPYGLLSDGPISPPVGHTRQQGREGNASLTTNVECWGGTFKDVGRVGKTVPTSRSQREPRMYVMSPLILCEDNKPSPPEPRTPILAQRFRRAR